MESRVNAGGDEGPAAETRGNRPLGPRLLKARQPGKKNADPGDWTRGSPKKEIGPFRNHSVRSDIVRPHLRI